MDCIFCKIINGDIPSYTIYENEYIKCFLDVNPLSKGHTLIVPKKHFKDIYDIEEEYLLEINKASKEIIKILDDKFKPNGYRFIQNNGILQEVKHYHLHIIPNYNRKSNTNNVQDVYNTIIK